MLDISLELTRNTGSVSIPVKLNDFMSTPILVWDQIMASCNTSKLIFSQQELNKEPNLFLTDGTFQKQAGIEPGLSQVENVSLELINQVQNTSLH